MARICQRCSHHNEAHAKFCLSCGAMLDLDAPADAADPLLGKVLLGRYRATSLLGEGGMGRVYLAEQKMGTATRKVAIKTLHPELSNDPQLVARFHRESETVIELRHPNTIQFYDFGELDDKTLIIVMEYIEGKALAKVLEQEGAVDPKRADKILVQVCGSLHEAHQRGIVHRDLKPENILLTNQGGQSDFVKVLDFGIAKRDDAEDPNQAKLTKQGMVLGTPPYMSPEQFSGQKLDARSDIYSLGIMAYEMLTGSLPFTAATPWEWATKHLTAQPTPIEMHPQAMNIPPNKKAAVMRALQKNREERQQTVLQFLQEFTGYQDADAAWTMATSSGGIVPKDGARAPAPTPGPMPQTGGWGQNMTPPPGYASAPGMGSAPGLMAAPGMVSAPGVASYPGQQSYPGYTTGAQPASGSGALGKVVAVGIVGLFVLAGGAGGLAWFLMQDDDGPTRTVQNIPTPIPDPNVMQPGVMQPNTPMVPTQPMQPLQPTPVPTPVPPVPTPVPPPTPVQPIQTQPEVTPTPNPREPRRGPSPADEARARGIVASGLAAARRNDFAGAVGALSQAQRLVGRNNPTTQELQGELSRRGSNQIGILLQQGRCPQAQALYRQLQSVGAAGASRQHFGDWCPAR